MALKCYPLPAGGLLALQAVAIGMASPETVYHEALKNFEVILLLIFMVAGIYLYEGFPAVHLHPHPRPGAVEDFDLPHFSAFSEPFSRRFSTP